MSDNPHPATPYPDRAYAWYVCSLLALVYILAYMDRYILALLIEPIKASLELTDFQIGLLIGPAFIILFVTAGLPIGWLVDRKRRSSILAVGIAVWSVLSAACGLARSFWSLFLVRVGVGIGETTVAPCAFSLIGDYFPKDIRPRAVALFSIGAPVGAGASYVIGGQLFEMIAAAPPVTLPIFGILQAWQSSFLLVGLPGLIVAALVWLTVREPKRQETLTERTQGPTLAEAANYIRHHKAAYGVLFAGVSCNVAIGVASFWMPALFERTFGWGVGQSGLFIGSVLIIAGVLGTTAGGWIASHLVKRGYAHGAYYTVFGGALLLVPFGILYPLMPTAELSAAMFAVAIFATTMTAATSPSCIIAITPGELRGQATALFYLVINLIGSLVTPPLLGAITDAFGNPKDLKYAIVIVTAGFGTVMLLTFWRGFESFKQSAVDRARVA